MKFKLDKKGMELTMNTVVIAAIVMIILVIMVMIITRSSSSFAGTVTKTCPCSEAQSWDSGATKECSLDQEKVYRVVAKNTDGEDCVDSKKNKLKMGNCCVGITG